MMASTSHATATSIIASPVRSCSYCRFMMSLRPRPPTKEMTRGMPYAWKRSRGFSWNQTPAAMGST